MVNTMISGSISSLTVFFLHPYFMRNVEKIYNYNPVYIVNGLLSGLVGITASCNNVKNEMALVIGFTAGLVYIMADFMLIKLKIDDPVGAS